MRLSVLTLTAAVGLLGFAATDQQAAAQTPTESTTDASSAGPANKDAARNPEVVISADRAEFARKISSFVNHITEFDLGDPARGMARWESPACPLVSGLTRDEGEYVLWRISDVARTIGAPLGGQHCKPNIFVIFSSKPEAYLRDLEKHHSQSVFNGATPTRIEAFIRAPQPVRSWYNTAEQTPEGLPLLSMSFPGTSQQNTVPSGGQNDVPMNVPVATNVEGSATTNPWSQASHLVMNAVMAIKHVLLIIDPTKFKGVSIGQMADYVTMASLAQIKLDNHEATDQSILALFDAAPQSRSQGLTDWDMAFLKAVYASEQKSVMQRSAISHEMIRTMATSN